MIDLKFKEKLIDYTSQFVRIPSRSSEKGGEEGKLQSLIAEIMNNLGARVRVFEPDEIPGFRDHPLCHGPDRQYTNRPTVIGELGPENAPALLILAHSDTVQITRPEDWTFDPFCGEIKNNKICGLGASDDKWGLAVMLVLMELLQSESHNLKKRIIFASTVDEENGIGNGTLLLLLAGIKAEAALYLDGVLFQACIGNCGGSFLYLRPKDEIDKKKLVQHEKLLAASCRELSRKRIPLFNKSLFRKNVIKEKSISLVKSFEKETQFFFINFYILPGEDRKTFENEIENLVSRTLESDLSLYEISFCEPWFEPSISSEDTPLIGILSECIHECIGKEAEVTTISKQDNFILIKHAKIPTVSFGIGTESGRGAYHQPDECIDINDLCKALSIVYNAVNRWLEDIEAHGTGKWRNIT